jgi:chromosome segregation ATPase
MQVEDCEDFQFVAIFQAEINCLLHESHQEWTSTLSHVDDVVSKAKRLRPLDYVHYSEWLEKSRKYIREAIEDLENQEASFNRCFSTVPKQIKANWARLIKTQKERRRQLDQRIGRIEDAARDLRNVLLPFRRVWLHSSAVAQEPA